MTRLKNFPLAALRLCCNERCCLHFPHDVPRRRGVCVTTTFLSLRPASVGMTIIGITFSVATQSPAAEDII